MREAILIVSFGSTHLDTLEKTIGAAEEEIRAAFPEIPCFRAFSSSIVRRRLKEKYSICVDSPEEALRKLEQAGCTHVTIQPTLLLPGEEYEKVCKAAASETMQISVGKPLLETEADITCMADIIREAYPTEEDTTLLAMGHGTAHAADAIYTRLRAEMNARGMELCTVEGSIDFETVVEALRQQPNRNIHLIPLLLVAGDHSKNDMAGTEPDSLRSLLENAGFHVTFSLRGLGELPAIRKKLVEKCGQVYAAR